MASRPLLADRGTELDASRPSGRLESDAEFLEKVEAVKTAVQEVQSNTRALERLHSAALLNISDAENAANQRALDQCVDRTDQALQWCRGQLRAMNQSKDRFPPNSPPYSLRSNQIAALTRSLQGALGTYKEVQERYRARYWDKAERQYRIVRPQASDAEVRQALADAQGGRVGAFAQDLRIGGEAKRAMDEAQERAREVGRLERSIGELAGMFQDLSLLLEAQDAKITASEYNVDETVGFLEDANKEVIDARNIRINTRRNLWILSAVCLLILLIIIIILIVQFKPK